MTATLGPCPECGGKGQASHLNGAGMPLGWCLDQKVCGFVCSLKHWNSMRRKMTREEATATWDTALRDCLNDKTEHALRKMGAVIIAALTGEKT